MYAASSHYPLVCQWASRLDPLHCYCEPSNKHGCLRTDVIDSRVPWSYIGVAQPSLIGRQSGTAEFGRTPGWHNRVWSDTGVAQPSLVGHQAGVVGSYDSSVSETPSNWFPQRLYRFPLPPKAERCSFCTALQHCCMLPRCQPFWAG